MVKVKLKEVVGGNFMAALNKISAERVNASAAFVLVQIFKKANVIVEEYEETRKKTLEKYASLNKDGEIQEDDKGEIKFKKAEDKTSAIEEIKDLLEQEVELPQLKLSLISDLTVDVNVIASLDSVILED